MANVLTKMLAVIGPTASGKTRLGIDLANALDGEIISADSVQIYRQMDVATAKPTPEERSQAPHHLINIIDPDQTFNAGNFVNAADKVIRDLVTRHKVPILLGGTSLYVRALINGIIQVPDTPDEIKDKVRCIVKEKGLSFLYQLLRESDPESAAQLHPNDVSRISRAMEVFWTTGKSIKFFQEDHRFQQKRYDVIKVGCEWDRSELYERINLRVLQMVEKGLIEETEMLLSKGYTADLPSMQTIGYKQAVAHVYGKMSRSEMIEDIQQKTRRYAKKQLTWYRRDRSVHWLPKGRLNQETIELVKQFLAHDTE